MTSIDVKALSSSRCGCVNQHEDKVNDRSELWNKISKYSSKILRLLRELFGRPIVDWDRSTSSAQNFRTSKSNTQTQTNFDFESCRLHNAQHSEVNGMTIASGWMLFLCSNRCDNFSFSGSLFRFTRPLHLPQQFAVL